VEKGSGKIIKKVLQKLPDTNKYGTELKSEQTLIYIIIIEGSDLVF